MNKSRSLNDLLLIHELAFILLVILAGAAGGVGIRLWDQSSQESQRINKLVQEIQQTRGDLYRQMKELFDAYFLSDPTAPEEYKNYKISIQKHFDTINSLAKGEVEQQAIHDLSASYQAFLKETQPIFDQHIVLSSIAVEKKLNSDLEADIFERYEFVSARAEKLLTLKQKELEERLREAKRISNALLIVPIVLSALLLVFSRIFLKRSIVKPVKEVVRATTEISAGHLEYIVPEEGAEEIEQLSKAINQMAVELKNSQEALIKTEKQAAQGLLVPMLAHNIRNPLASIRATAQVADDGSLSQDAKESFEGIIRTVDRLERWTGSLLAYLHPLKPQAVSTTLRQVIQGALVPLQQKIKERQIEIELPDWETTDDRIMTDEHLLEQMLYNLLQNSLDAIPSKSKLEIHAEVTPLVFRVLIADRGPGMPFTPVPSDLSPGPSTKRFGTGLGIPFSFKVCEALGGKLEFISRQGGGTLVNVELPKHYTS